MRYEGPYVQIVFINVEDIVKTSETTVPGLTIDENETDVNPW